MVATHRWCHPIVFSVVLASTAFGAQSNGVSARELRSGAVELVLDQGLDQGTGQANGFHVANGAVRNLRSFGVEGSTVRVAVWEQGDGVDVFVPYYAIFKDGKNPSVVTATSYEIGMQRATFDPAVSSPSFAGSSIGAGGEMFLVQFVTQPLYEYQQALRQAGATVYDYVSNHSHLVRMDAATRARVEALPFVRWVGGYHGEYKLETSLLAALNAGLTETARYNIRVFERGLAGQEPVGAKIAALGGKVERMSPNGHRMEATLSPAQLRAVAGFDEIQAIDVWGEPSSDLDNARIVSGANYVQTVAGFTGVGVRGEVMDGGIRQTHAAFQANGGVLLQTPASLDFHGTNTTGCVFGDGTGNAAGRGLIPSGGKVFASYTQYLSVYADRWALTADLVNPTLPYRCVFQSNSWGDPQTTVYNTISAETDELIFDHDILIAQSQSNLGSQSSRPQAWAKNIVSVGGVSHNNNTNDADDSWGFASIGPAQDGRIKPDLCHFYDSVLCTDGGSDLSYTTGFGGTSAATPIVAGYFGLFFDMWNQGVFGNPTPGADPFDNKPHFTLAKAALINTAKQYTFSGTGHNLTRTHQGWGKPNAQTLYDRRAKTFFVNQTEVLDNLETKSYSINVVAGEPSFNVTLVYRDPAGTVSATQHRKNDLNLRVTEPNGTTIRWGNNGLLAGNFSTTGGAPNTKDTVECVIVNLPVAGTWTVDVIGADINTDIVFSAPGNNADFALWLTGGTLDCPPPANYCVAKQTSLGTFPSIGSNGTPSFSINGFELTLTNGTQSKSALVFWGPTQQSSAFHGGTLCILPPLQRGPVVTTDPTGAATSAFAIDSSLIGSTLNFQWWMRDPADPFADGLSDARAVTFCE